MTSGRSRPAGRAALAASRSASGSTSTARSSRRSTSTTRARRGPGAGSTRAIESRGRQPAPRLRQSGPRARHRRRSSRARAPRTVRSRCRTESCRTIREYERTSTTVVNAYVQPMMASYLRRCAASSTTLGSPAPLLIMQSNGGIMTADDGRRARPVYIVESGPAAGVIAAAELARRLRLDERHQPSTWAGRPPRRRWSRTAATARTASSRSAAAISAGQPSVARRRVRAERAVHRPRRDRRRRREPRLDRSGRRAEGRAAHAGAVPGPVCYGRGGDQPTVTDANVLLGYLNPAGLLDGTMPLEVDRAEAVFGREIADRLGLDLLAAAYGIHELANASMIRAIKSVSIQRGRDPRDFTLVAFGGSGPIHAAGIARELGIRHILVPPRPGVFSAVGLLQATAEVIHDDPSAARRPRQRAGRARRQLERDARRGSESDALRAARSSSSAWAEMRYVGQGSSCRCRCRRATAPGSTAAPAGRLRGRARADVRAPDRQSDRGRVRGSCRARSIRRRSRSGRSTAATPADRVSRSGVLR